MSLLIPGHVCFLITNTSCSAPDHCASPRPLLLVSSKVQLHILRVIRHRLTRSNHKNTTHHPRSILPKTNTTQANSNRIHLREGRQRNTFHGRACACAKQKRGTVRGSCSCVIIIIIIIGLDHARCCREMRPTPTLPPRSPHPHPKQGFP